MKIGTLLLDILEHKKNDLANNIGAMDEVIFKRYSDEYDSILQDGKKEVETLNPKSYVRKKEQNLLNRLEEYKANHLLFASNYLVPFTNNQAERDFRWVKTHHGMWRYYSLTKKSKENDIPILRNPLTVKQMASQIKEVCDLYIELKLSEKHLKELVWHYAGTHGKKLFGKNGTLNPTLEKIIGKKERNLWRSCFRISR